MRNYHADISYACSRYIALLAHSTHSADLQTHISQIPEYPNADNYDLNDPVYTSFYKSITPGRIGRLFDYFGANKKKWTSYAFEKQLLRMIESQERKNLSGRQVAKLILDGPATLYVFGDIQAHIHSLARSLNFLREEKILNDHFKKFTAEHTYIIFNGDFIDRSPYSLECLSLVMQLLEPIPQQFYIRGKHEDKDYWQNFGLKRELMQRMSHLLPYNSPADEIPLGDTMRILRLLALSIICRRKK